MGEWPLPLGQHNDIQVKIHNSERKFGERIIPKPARTDIEELLPFFVARIPNYFPANHSRDNFDVADLCRIDGKDVIAE